MLQNLTGWHALIVLGIVLLIFGAAKLPALARGIGQSVRILKDEARDETSGGPAADAPQAPLTAAPAGEARRPETAAT